MRRWLHRGCDSEWWDLRGVHGGDVQKCHGLRVVYELPEQCGVRSGEHQLRMSCRIHGGRGERGELHGVCCGDVQAWRGLCGVLFVSRGQVRGEVRNCLLLDVPVRLECVCDGERGGHGVYLLLGVHGCRRRTLHRMWGGDV